MAEDAFRDIESAHGPLPAHIFGYTAGLAMREGKRPTAKRLSRQSQWAPFPCYQLQVIDEFYRTNSSCRACSQFLKNKIVGPGLQLKENTPVFTGDKLDAFKEFLKTAWQPFAREVLDQLLCFGFCACSWVPHEDFIGRPVVVDIPNTRILYKFNHLREIELQYDTDDTRRLTGAPLLGDEDDGADVNSGESDDDGGGDGRRETKREQSRRRVKRKRRTVREAMSQETREPWTFFRDKPTINGQLASPLMSVIRDARYGDLVRELMVRAHEQRVSMPLVIAKKVDQSSATLSIATDALALQTSPHGLSSDPSSAGPSGPGAGGGGGGGMPPPPPPPSGRFMGADCPPATMSRLDMRSVSQVAAARVAEMFSYHRNRGRIMGPPGGAPIPGAIRLQPNEHLEKTPDFKDPPKVLEFMHKMDEKIYMALGVPMQLVTRDGMNVTLSKSDSSSKDSASERFRETAADLGSGALVTVLNKMYERIYLAHFAVIAITRGDNDSDTDSGSGAGDDGGRVSPAKPAPFKNRCQFSLVGLVEPATVQSLHDMGVLDYRVYREYAHAFSGIPLSDIRLFPKQPPFTFELGFIPTPEAMASAYLKQGKAEALVAHAMPQPSTMAKSASGKGTFPIPPRAAPMKASMDAIDNGIQELGDRKKKQRTSSPPPSKKSKKKTTNETKKKAKKRST